MGMDFRGLVWNRVRINKNQVAHPHQEFPGVTPTRPMADLGINYFRNESW